MIITTTINSDLLIKGPTQEVHAVQGDRYTRKVTLRLHANKTPWMPTKPVNIVIRYRKPDGTGGAYDALPNGEKAWSQEENAISFLLAPQMLTVPGRVSTQVELNHENSILATFPLDVVVEKDASADVVQSEDYTNWQEQLEKKAAEALIHLRQSGAFIGATPQLEIGSVVTLPEGSNADAKLRGTAENPILDLYLPKGPEIAVDSTLSQTNKAADAKAVGDALAQKAPGGFGLGEAAVSVSTLNYHGETGFIHGYTGGPYASNWVGINISYGNNYSRGYQELVDIQNKLNVKVRRHKYNGLWSQWEYENPPLVPGMEYATTERWNSKVVYTKLIQCGTIPGGGSCMLSYSGVTTIRYQVIDGTCVLPFLYESLDNSNTCWAALTGDRCLVVYDNTSTNHDIKCQVWYTKT